MKPIIVLTVAALGALLCQAAPTPESIVAIPAEEIPLQNVKNIQFNVARVLDHSLSTLTFADCIKYLSESLDKRMKPLLNGFGKFSLKDLLVELSRRKHEFIAKVHNKGGALLSNVHRKGNEFIADAHIKTDGILATVHDKGEELLSKKKHIISSVHDKGEELLSKKKQIIAEVQDKGEELLAKKKHMIADVHDKGEELLAKKKQIIVNAHHTGEQFIEEVMEEAKKKISEIKAHHDDLSSRRKREAEEEDEAVLDVDAVADLLEKEDLIRDLNEVDTKTLNDFDAFDLKYPSVFDNKKPIKPVYGHHEHNQYEQEYYTLPELARLVFNWARHNLSLRRLFRRPSIVSA